MKTKKLFFMALIACFSFFSCSNNDEEEENFDANNKIRPKSVVMTIKPANNPTEACIWSLNDNISGAGGGSVVMAASTWQGRFGIYRMLIQFDLSRIYPSDEIVRAKISLKSIANPPSNLFTPSNQGSNNSVYVRQIASPWDAQTVNWSSQPFTTTNNQATISHTSLPSEDVIVDVTNMVRDMVRYNRNYGFMFQLVDEKAYTTRQFYSSFYTTPENYPCLTIEYR